MSPEESEYRKATGDEVRCGECDYYIPSMRRCSRHAVKAVYDYWVPIAAHCVAKNNTCKYAIDGAKEQNREKYNIENQPFHTVNALEFSGKVKFKNTH